MTVDILTYTKVTLLSRKADDIDGVFFNLQRLNETDKTKVLELLEEVIQ